MPADPQPPADSRGKAQNHLPIGQAESDACAEPAFPRATRRASPGTACPRWPDRLDQSLRPTKEHCSPVFMHPSQCGGADLMICSQRFCPVDNQSDGRPASPVGLQDSLFIRLAAGPPFRSSCGCGLLEDPQHRKPRCDPHLKSVVVHRSPRRIRPSFDPSTLTLQGPLLS